MLIPTQSQLARRCFERCCCDTFLLLSIVTNGTLSANSEGNPDKKIVVAGTTMQLASKYKFTALREAFNVNKLTIMDEGAAGVGGFGVTPVRT